MSNECKGATPRPWKIFHGGMEGDDGFAIGSNNVLAERVKVVAECWPCTIVDNQHRRELKANAELILQAVNTYDEREALIREFSLAAQRVLAAIEGSPGAIETADAILVLKAALAKANKVMGEAK